MMMQTRLRQMQLELQMKTQMEAQLKQGMTDQQRETMAEQHRMRAMMMASEREQMMAAQQEQMIIAAYREHMMADYMRMAGNGGGVQLPPIGMPFARDPPFFSRHMGGGPGAEPQDRPRTESPDGPSDPTEARDFESAGASPRGARVRNGRPGVVYGDWEVEEVEDEK
jgi:hypothetical protein